MKYDASMTQFHGDIVAAVRLMCGKDTDARSNSEGASPAPLRDYLKNQYSNSGRGDDGFMYLCYPSKGMEIKLDREIGNNGDTTITLSWSQVAKFIRDNTSEIFGEENKPGNAENSPSIEVLDLDIRTFNAMKRAGINTLADAERLADYSVNHPDGLPLLSDAHRETIEAFKAYRDSQARQKTDFPCDDCGYDEKNCCNYPETPYDYCVCGDKRIPKNKETYLEIFKEHYPNVNCSELYDDYCPGDFFEGAKEVQHKACPDCPNKCESCWNIPANEEWCETVDSVPEGWKAAVEPEHKEEEQESPAEISAPAQTEPTTFDYSVLDTDTAASLRNCETIIRTETAGYFTLLGAKFKEAQDLLANHSTGTFEQWYTAMGFKRQTVYNLIKRFEFSSSPTIGERAEVFEALPLTLSYEISKPDAPAELVDKVLDGDITSNAEYQKLKKQLEETTEQLEQQKINNQHLSEANDRIYAASKRNREDYDKERLKVVKLRERIEELECEADEADREYAAMADREDQHETLIADLKRQIKELESRPVEVAVQPDEKALAEKDKEISELKEEISRLSDNSVKSFVIKLTLDEYVQLQDIVKTSGNLCIVNAVNSARMIKL